jgi:hypothetical protein
MEVLGNRASGVPNSQKLSCYYAVFLELVATMGLLFAQAALTAFLSTRSIFSTEGMNASLKGEGTQKWKLS